MYSFLFNEQYFKSRIPSEYPKLQFPDPISLDRPVMVIPNFIDASLTTHLRNQILFKQNSFEPMTKLMIDHTNPLASKNDEDMSYRSAKNILDVDTTLLKALEPAMLEEVNKWFTLSDKIKFTYPWIPRIYDVGDKYLAHADNMEHEPPFKMFQSHVITFMLYLNDWTSSFKGDMTFEGGELVFSHIADENRSRFTVYPEAGMLVAFPGNILYQHLVNPVRKGQRICFTSNTGAV